MFIDRIKRKVILFLKNILKKEVIKKKIKEYIKLSISILIGIVILSVLLVIANFIGFELLTDVPSLRKHIGHEVEYETYVEGFWKFKYRGTLTECHYEFNDQWGFLGVRIGIDGDAEFSNPHYGHKSTYEVSGSRMMTINEVKRIKIK